MAFKIDFMRVLPFVMQTVTNVAYIDSNQDKKVDGKEKMAFVQKQVKLAMDAFPDVAAKLKSDPAKTELFIDKLVEAFDVIVK